MGAALLTLLLVLTSVLAGTHATAAFAAESKTPEITISPTREKLAIDPGGSYEGTFDVFNSGEADLEFTAYVTPFQVGDVDYLNPNFEEEAPRTQLSRWVTILSENTRLAPDDLTQVKYRIDVPTDVPAGGQYAAIFVETVVDDADDAQIAVKSRAGLLLYVTVNGDTREAGKITHEKLSWWQPEAPLSWATTVQNTGNTDFFVGSEMKVTDLFGNVAFESSRQSPVLPETSRRITLEWADSAPGIYRVSTLTDVLGDDTEGTRWVVVLPLPLLLGIVVGIGFVVALIWFVRRTRKRRVGKAVDAAVKYALSAQAAGMEPDEPRSAAPRYAKRRGTDGEGSEA